MADLVLASKSPRRKALLESLGLNVLVCAKNAHTLKAFEGDEVQHEGESPADYGRRIALEKFEDGLAARDAAGVDAKIPVLAADTVVTIDGLVLGKPVDEAEARRFLERLSGREHEVLTTVVLGTSTADAKVKVSRTGVTFKILTTDEIDAYAASAEPYDKAGGYGIQGTAGLFISRIDGSFTGVMGLPVFETGELLREAGIELLKP